MVRVVDVSKVASGRGSLESQGELHHLCGTDVRNLRFVLIARSSKRKLERIGDFRH